MFATSIMSVLCDVKNYYIAVICWSAMVSYIHEVNGSLTSAQKWILRPCDTNAILSGNGKNDSIWAASELICNIQATQQPWVHVTNYSPDTELCYLLNFDVLVMVAGSMSGADQCWSKAGTMSYVSDSVCPGIPIIKYSWIKNSTSTQLSCRYILQSMSLLSFIRYKF